MKVTPAQVDAAGGCAACQFQQVPKDSATAGDPSHPPGPSVLILDPNKHAYIGIELVDTKKRPVPAALFELQLPDGSKITGSLDAAGKVRIEGIDPGTCQVTFPSIDRRDFAK